MARDPSQTHANRLSTPGHHGLARHRSKWLKEGSMRNHQNPPGSPPNHLSSPPFNKKLVCFLHPAIDLISPIPLPTVLPRAQPPQPPSDMRPPYRSQCRLTNAANPPAQITLPSPKPHPTNPGAHPTASACASSPPLCPSSPCPSLPLAAGAGQAGKTSGGG